MQLSVLRSGVKDGGGEVVGNWWGGQGKALKKQKVRIQISPVHTALSQDWRRDRRRHDGPSLGHGRRAGCPCVVTVLNRTVSLEASERILRIEETSPPLPTDSVLVKVSSRWPDTHRIGWIREPTVRELPATLHSAVDEEEKNQNSDRAQRADNANNSVLAGCICRRASRSRTGRASRSGGIGVGDGEE